MVIIEGKGTLSVTEPGHDTGTYFERADIHVYGDVVHFASHGKYHTAASAMCLIGWESEPTVRFLDKVE